jgi:hypothetical protein
MLRCAHIGEVQYGWYNPEEVEVLKEKNIKLLGRGFSFQNGASQDEKKTAE